MSPLGVHVCTFGSADALIGRAGGGAVGQGPETRPFFCLGPREVLPSWY